MNAARGVALGALGVATLVVAVVLFSGGSAHTYKLRFENAGQLVRDNDVQVGGRRIGSVKDIVLTDDNQAEVTIEVSEPYAPLHEGTRAVIRATSLSGIANRYISLTPGPNNASRLPEGAVLESERTTSPVDLDQLFNTLDPSAREALQQVIQGSATQFEGRGAENRRAAKYFNPLLSTSRRLVNEVNRDQQAFEDLIVEGARVTTTLAERRADITGLVSNTNRTAAAIAAENDALAEALGLLPGTLRRGNSTFVNLRATLDDLDRLTEESLPATRRLAPFFRQLRPLVADLEPTIRDLRLLITRPGRSNDTIELLRKAPRLASLAEPAFANTITSLRKSQPVFDFIRPYTPELVGWFRDFGTAAANYDANGHYARIQPIFNAFQFTDNPAGGTLRALPPGERFNSYEVGPPRRCPGAASQPAADGSAPWRDSDGELECDPDDVPPGP